MENFKMYENYRNKEIPMIEKIIGRQIVHTKIGDYIIMNCITVEDKGATVIFHKDCGPIVVAECKTPTEEYRSFYFWKKLIINSPPLVLRDIYTNKIALIRVK